MKRLFLLTLSLVACAGAILSIGGSANAAMNRKVPAFEFRGLDEREYRLTDAQFQGKPLLITAFTTWNETGRSQAREVAAFHKAHPEVLVIAFVVNALPEARDFVRQEGLTFPCYKADSVSRINTTLNRLFETKKDKTLTFNRLPFAILADKERTVRYSTLGLGEAKTLSAEYAKSK